MRRYFQWAYRGRGFVIVLALMTPLTVLFQNMSSSTDAQSVSTELQSVLIAKTLFDSALVTNSKNEPLPKSWKTYDTDEFRALGGSGRYAPGMKYAGDSIAGDNAFFLIATSNPSDWTRIWFSLPKLPAERSWFLSFSVGHLNAKKSEDAQISIIAGARSPIDNSEESKVLSTLSIQSGQTQKVQIPLGLWPLKKYFTLRFKLNKVNASPYQVGAVFDDIKLISGPLRPETGMQRAGLAREARDPISGQFVARERVFRNLAYLNSKWFRTGWSTGANQQVKDVVARARRAGQKVLLTLMPDAADYDTADPYIYRKDGSTKSLPLSTINHLKYRARLKSFLQDLKNSQLAIDAFEIGNEMDTITFNGDSPNDPDRTFTEQETLKWVTGYALFLESSALIIKNEFPQAKVITFGLANAPNSFVPFRGFHLLDPAHDLARMKNLVVNGVASNYFRYVDGIGLHIYPNPNASEISERNGSNLLKDNVSELGFLNKPFWITEWGYRRPSFSQPESKNTAGETRNDLFYAFLDMLNQQTQFELGPVFLYAMESPTEKMDEKIVDANREIYTLVDESKPFDSPDYWLPEALLFQRLYRW